MAQWQAYPGLPWLVFTSCGCARGGYTIFNKKTNQEVHAPTMNDVHQYAADVSGQSARVPLGDAVHAVTKRMGLKRCTGCAKRQSLLNRLFG